MARIIYAWEWGGGLGHLTLARPIAIALREQGHDVSFIVPDLFNAIRILGPHGFDLYQAPIWRRALADRFPPTSYAEMLLAHGFGEPAQLFGMVKAWREILLLLNPDLIIFDHAPTALLASRAIVCKRATIGHGFFIPPARSPMPAFWPWRASEPNQLISTEQKALDACNGVLQSLGVPNMQRLCDLFDVDETLLTTWRELDHYPNREHAVYLGPEPPSTSGIEPTWPMLTDHEKRIFVYVKKDYAGLERLLRVFQESPHAYLIYMQSPDKRWMEKYSSSKLHFANEPVNLNQACAQADLIVCHSGLGTVNAALAAGKPLLLMPQQLEQLLMAKCVEQLGAGISLRPDMSQRVFSNAIENLLAMDSYKQASMAFANKYARIGEREQLGEIVARITERISNGI